MKRLPSTSNRMMKTSMLEKRAVHAYVQTSTPNSLAGETTELQFSIVRNKNCPFCQQKESFRCSLSWFQNSRNHKECSSRILEQCDVFLRNYKRVDFQDVLYELKNRILCENEMIELLKWWIDYNQDDKNDVDSEKERFMQFTIIHDDIFLLFESGYNSSGYGFAGWSFTISYFKKFTKARS